MRASSTPAPPTSASSPSLNSRPSSPSFPAAPSPLCTRSAAFFSSSKIPANLPVAEALSNVTTIATDNASRSSTAYTHILFEHFLHTRPTFTEHRADAVSMLASADAALLIGDPALLARENRAQSQSQSRRRPSAPRHSSGSTSPRSGVELTGLPWVAAVWAVRPVLFRSPASPAQLAADLTASRDAGLAHIDTLVREWTPASPSPPTPSAPISPGNIHYTLDPDCLRAIEHFRLATLAHCHN